MPFAHKDLASGLSMDTYNSRLYDRMSIQYTVATMITFCCSSDKDNVLQDGGYHVPFAHKDLASSLSMDTYNSQLYDMMSIQSCSTQEDASEPHQRLGQCLLPANHALTVYMCM